MFRNTRFSISAIVVSIISAVAIVAASGARPQPAADGRRVAITFDDLPIAGVLPRDIASSGELTRKLLAGIGAHHVPAIGFVNEDKLTAADGAVDPQRVELLRRWLDAGIELGNHSYSHADLHTTPLDVFEADVLKGERVTRPLMEQRGLAPRFFRHPFLHTGRDLEKRKEFESFLAAHGYRVAPVTIDNDGVRLCRRIRPVAHPRRRRRCARDRRRLRAVHEAKSRVLRTKLRTALRAPHRADTADSREHAERRSVRRARHDVRAGRLPVHHARSRAGGRSLPIAGHVCRDRRHHLDSSLGAELERHAEDGSTRESPRFPRSFSPGQSPDEPPSGSRCDRIHGL